MKCTLWIHTVIHRKRIQGSSKKNWMRPKLACVALASQEYDWQKYFTIAVQEYMKHLEIVEVLFVLRNFFWSVAPCYYQAKLTSDQLTVHVWDASNTVVEVKALGLPWNWIKQLLRASMAIKQSKEFFKGRSQNTLFYCRMELGKSRATMVRPFYY